MEIPALGRCPLAILVVHVHHWHSGHVGFKHRIPQSNGAASALRFESPILSRPMCASPKIQTRPAYPDVAVPMNTPQHSGAVSSFVSRSQKGPRTRSACAAPNPCLFCSVLDATLSSPLPFVFRHSRYRGAQGELLVFCGSIGRVSSSSLWLLSTRRSGTRRQVYCCARLQVGFSVPLF